MNNLNKSISHPLVQQFLDFGILSMVNWHYLLHVYLTVPSYVLVMFGAFALITPSRSVHPFEQSTPKWSNPTWHRDYPNWKKTCTGAHSSRVDRNRLIPGAQRRCLHDRVGSIRDRDWKACGWIKSRCIELWDFFCSIFQTSSAATEQGVFLSKSLLASRKRLMRMNLTFCMYYLLVWTTCLAVKSRNVSFPWRDPNDTWLPTPSNIVNTHQSHLLQSNLGAVP